ncbi:MAG: protein jag [Clostridia bacterium]|nr:protein jag [Clostridia bacterium]MDE7328599.1 protein jag [Clostridia bacterium]
MKSIEITANSYAEALKQALDELGLEENQVEAEKISETGIIRKKVTVRVTQKVDGASMVSDFINGIIQRMGIQCFAKVEEQEDAFLVSLSGEDTGVLIGYRGDVLDSLQYLSLLVLNKDNPLGKRLVIDGENYRERRIATLSKLAKKIAFRVAKNRKAESLEPMNPFERRIIHSALHDDRFVTTESHGEEPNRYVVIAPKKPNYDRKENGERRERRSSDRDRQPSSQRVAPQSSANHQSSEGKNFNKTGVGRMKSYGGDMKKFF